MGTPLVVSLVGSLLSTSYPVNSEIVTNSDIYTYISIYITLLIVGE